MQKRHPIKNHTTTHHTAQGMKYENRQLAKDGAVLASELALATKVLETIGVLPKPESGVSNQREEVKDASPIVCLIHSTYNKWFSEKFPASSVAVIVFTRLAIKNVRAVIYFHFFLQLELRISLLFNLQIINAT